MEAVTALKFMRGKLVADTTLMALITGVYNDVAPDSAAYPFAMLAYQDGADELGVGGTFLVSGMSFVVQVVDDDASYAPLETAVERIRVLLHGATGTAGNGAVYECLRSGPVQYREKGTDGKTYSHLGDLYELVVRG